ncbi:hypothetical protein PHYBLDRAFT_7220, partial [Phycomyces blakesleeanus NRRL 1555(-)]
LMNLCPIALINSDAKVFTHLMNAHMISAVTTLITPYQTGFVQGRFIADNGML